MPELHMFKAGRFQRVVLAAALQAFGETNAGASRIEGDPLSNCDSRLSAACVRLNNASVSRIDGWLIVNMWFSPQRRAHILNHLHGFRGFQG
eukprot:6543523-Pyramimonas_sp.AAC.1